MSKNESNRPLRVFERVLQGGLGKGNIGVIAARHGTGKVAVLMSIALDKAIQGHSVLQVSTERSVAELRAYRDEVLNEMERSLNLADRAGTQTSVERHTRFHTYRPSRNSDLKGSNPASTAAAFHASRVGAFSIDRLRTTLTFARDHAEFSPELIEIEGWPDFDAVSEEELRELKVLAQEFDCEVWLTDHTHRDTKLDAASGLPSNLARFDKLLSVVVALEPESQVVPLRFLKAHGKPIPASVHLYFDPKSMLLRWS